MGHSILRLIISIVLSVVVISFRVPAFTSSRRLVKHSSTKCAEISRLKYSYDDYAPAAIEAQPSHMIKPMKLGVLLLNLGGPESMEVKSSVIPAVVKLL
jgi:hypothetical protein